MPNFDFGGARGSGLGDDFHELWALRRALDMLLPESDVAAITVEGMLPEDEKGVPSDTWDGVDCTFYHGDETIENATKVVIDQLKYSGSDPNQNWTVSRLTASTAKTTNNSVIRKLAKAFFRIDQMRPGLLDDGALKVRLVSNQSISSAVLEALPETTQSASTRETLRGASGLGARAFDRFCTALDFSLCGTTNLMMLEESAISSISEWTGDDASDTRDLLLKKIRNLMRPEEKRAAIRKDTVLGWLGYARKDALFPCPSRVIEPTRLIMREDVRAIAHQVIEGTQRTFIHGIGGCGKSTALFEIKKLLPEGSKLITYDCYGGGTYQNSNAYRHRREDAFVQLANELALECKMPSFLPSSRVKDFAREFHRQLVRAGALLSRQDPSSLLLIAIDAADNAVTAARARKEEDRCFVTDFLMLGELPSNVRLIVSARTGQISELGLPSNFVRNTLVGFTENETAEFVSPQLDSISGAWILDFHLLSKGNPRVQNYAITFGGGKAEQTLAYLRPNGKSLNDVFRAQLDFAMGKATSRDVVEQFCAALIELPRPIPIADLAAVSGVVEGQIVDICSDLEPGLQLTLGAVSFADEDFEHFISDDAASDRKLTRTRIADYFSRTHHTSEYAAEHYAQALVADGRGIDLLELIKNEAQPEIIADPSHRRRVQRQRLRLALFVCRENHDTADAIITILIAAEALNTDSAIEDIVEENVDLAAAFSPDEVDRIVFRDPENQKLQGPALCYSLALAARAENWVEVREIRRQLRSWDEVRTQYHDSLEGDEHLQSTRQWDIPDTAFAAVLEAELRTDGAQATFDLAMSWRPRSWVFASLLALLKRLYAMGENTLLDDLNTFAKSAGTPWRFAFELQKCLVMPGFVPTNLVADVLKLFSRGVIARSQEHQFEYSEPRFSTLAELMLTACECIVARSENPEVVLPILAEIASPHNRLSTRLAPYQTASLACLLRAWTLLETLQAGKADCNQFLVEPNEPTPEEAASEQSAAPKRKVSRVDRKLSEYVSVVGPFYAARAAVLTGKDNVEQQFEKLKTAASSLSDDNYRLYQSYHNAQMREACALSVAKLMLVPNVARTALSELALNIVQDDRSPETWAKLIDAFSVDPLLHAELIKLASDRAAKIKVERANATSKVSALIALSRCIEPMSPDDARVLFSDAIEVAAEIDENVINELMVLENFATQLRSSPDREERRRIATDFAVVVSDAAFRLENTDHFPWHSVSLTLARLDFPTSLACVARWEDEAITPRTNSLHVVATEGLLNSDLTPAQFAALLPLHSGDATPAPDMFLKAIEMCGADGKQLLASEIARNELLDNGLPQQRLLEAIAQLPSKDDFWCEHAARTIPFLQEIQDSTRSEPEKHQPVFGWDEGTEPAGPFDFSRCDCTSIASLQRTWEHFDARSRPSRPFVSFGRFLQQIRPDHPRNRVKYLDALSAWEADSFNRRYILAEITACLTEWAGSPAIRDWTQSRLPEIILDSFLEASAYIRDNDAVLGDMLAISALTDGEKQQLLLTGIERHADSFGAVRLYHLIRFLGNFVDPEVSRNTLRTYSRRLKDRVKPKEQACWDLNDLPNNPAEAMGRFFSAYLSDIGIGTRWRAAHGLRIACRTGDGAVLREVIACSGRRIEGTFRDGSAALYWLASRLWLVIALDRIALESPSICAEHIDFLVSQAIGDELPHMLVREFARSALLKLETQGAAAIDPTLLDAVRSVNQSSLPPVVAHYHELRARHSRPPQDEIEPRFRFDERETLEGWYQPAARAFADVTTEEFVSRAEDWIVDQWGVTGDIWRWDEEPRRGRLGPGTSTMHRDGSLPDVERYNTYVEWHAMWCVLGDIVTTRALRRDPDGDDYGSLEYWLGRFGLTFPPNWLSDLRGPKPLEPRFWRQPAKDSAAIDAWTDEIEEEEFLIEAGLENQEWLVIAASHTLRSSEFRKSVNINAALVATETAAALCRSLQACTSSWDYHLPQEESESEIDLGEFQLKGLLRDIGRDHRIDGQDPTRMSLARDMPEPGSQVCDRLKAERSDGPVTVWKNSSGEVLIERVAWSETPSGADDRDYYDPVFRTDGHWLRIKRTALKTFLEEVGMDLIIEVEIDKRNSGHESSGHSSKTKRRTYDRLYVFRHTGALDAAHGCVGTW
ncbi:hypothetical protein HFN69_21945 [Rhizobium laguerreae]|uniref:hypothetical protein n=1 Tax=Rhizobium laguerreae TaxID=1076926 RepID=UPI001C925861|nr:hypothetical protein [Rhizobium laguerreae]MBY3544784.1 hypothetical protein [Rhizobium laguerreae]MBY3549241.1 hypothetical protein [Rhizobium laguerreae]